MITPSLKRDFRRCSASALSGKAGQSRTDWPNELRVLARRAEPQRALGEHVGVAQVRAGLELGLVLGEALQQVLAWAGTIGVSASVIPVSQSISVP